MSNKLRDVFSTEMNDYYRQVYEQLLEAAIESRTHPPRFKKDSEGDGKYVADPFGGFYGDCTDCVHYEDSPYDFVTGGTCMLDGSGCGYGFTCQNHRFIEKALYEVENLEKELQKKDGEPLG